MSEKFEKGDYVLCTHNMTFYKVDLVSKSNSLLRLHLSHKTGDIVANGFLNDNAFVIRNHAQVKTIETNVFTLDSVIQFFGWVSLAFVLLYFSVKFFG